MQEAFGFPYESVYLCFRKGHILLPFRFDSFRFLLGLHKWNQGTTPFELSALLQLEAPEVLTLQKFVEA